ncbi:MAG: 30S ribosomal protein S18 [Actinomycetota bacterium]
MAKKQAPRRPAADKMSRRPPRACPFCRGEATVDWKDTQSLRKFLSDRGKIRARRVTGVCVQHQKDVAGAIKVAREVALLPYLSR